MPPLLLLHPRDLKISVAHFETTPHLLQRFRRDGLDAKLPLALGEVEPQFAPCRVAGALAEELRHLGAAVPRRQGGLVGVKDRGAGFGFHRLELLLQV